MDNNPKLKGLQGQIDETYQDFEDMKRTREEARKQLEAKFQDIYKKIEKLKEAMDAEAVRVNNSLKAFQNKFECLLKEISDSIRNEISVEREFVRSKFVEHESNMSRLERMIIEEREDRLRQTDEQLKPIRSQLTKLEQDQDTERQERIQNEKSTLRFIEDNVFEINESINKERDDRNSKITVLREEFTKEIKNRDNSLDEFKKKINLELKIVKDEIMLEMSNRFSHQNEIIDNISNFLRTFQQTLKVVGKDT